MKNNKFKVWCKNNKEWERDNIFISDDGSLFQYGRSGGLIQISNDTHDVLWYTGLTDKNEKEICEGDIVEVSPVMLGGTHRGFIKFVCGMYVIELTKSNYAELYSTLSDVKFKTKVIGNVHDNPELLSKKRRERV